MGRNAEPTTSSSTNFIQTSIHIKNIYDDLDF